MQKITCRLAALLLLVAVALNCSAIDVALRRRVPGTFPAELVRAREHMELHQPGLQAFHVELAFESTSEVTGEATHGTLVEDWWTTQWWRQVVTVNGRRSERVQVGGEYFQEDDPDFYMPLRARRVLTAFWRPFPKEEAANHTQEIELGTVTLHCMTLPNADEEPDLQPEPRTFCVDKHDDLRATMDPNYRVIYNQIEAVGPRRVAFQVVLANREGRVGSVHVKEWKFLSSGPEALQHPDAEEQVRLATARPRTLIRLLPAVLERQMISLDVRMVPQATVRLVAGQHFAAVHILEADGRLLDAEMISASDDAAVVLARRVLKQTSFRQNGFTHGLLCEGTVVLAVPIRR